MPPPLRYPLCLKDYDCFAPSVLWLNAASFAYSFLVCSLK